MAGCRYGAPHRGTVEALANTLHSLRTLWVVCGPHSCELLLLDSLSPGADGDVLLLLGEGVGTQLCHNLHRPGGSLPCELEGSGHINDDLLLCGLGLAVGADRARNRRAAAK